MSESSVGLPFEPRGVAVRAEPEFDAVVTALPRPPPSSTYVQDERGARGRGVDV